MDLKNDIVTFANFLDASWEVANKLLLSRSYTSDEDSVNDWLQANWELLLERRILKRVDEHLEIYGDGADFYGSSSRITDFKAIPTHEIRISFLTDSGYDHLNDVHCTGSYFIFDRLVSFSNNYYFIKPPFSYVLALDKDHTERVFFLEDITFELRKK